MAIAVDTPNSNVDAYVELRNESGYLTYDYNSGPGYDAYISHYEIPADGTYYVLVENESSATGSYQLRVERARGIDLESDKSYNNDSIGGADLVTLVQTGNQRSGTVAGTIMAGESGNVDEDYFALGTVDAGETIFSRTSLPDSSTLTPIIEIRNAGNQIVSINPNPTDASIARYDVVTTGEYYIVIVAQGGEGVHGQYLLDATIGPTSELQFADLSVIDIVLPSPSAVTSGDTIHLEWTVGNYGTATTDTDTWFDRIVLSANDTYGDADDRYLGSVEHSGTLAVGVTDVGQADITLPLDISGLFSVFIETDEDSQVFEFTLTDNNVSRSSGQLDIARALLPDLLVEDLATSGPSSPVLATWNTANRGTLEAAGGFTERIFVRNETKVTVVLDSELVVSDAVGPDSTISRSESFDVTTPGRHSITITTDSSDDFYEFNPSGHLAAEQNNSTQSFFDVTLDLTVQNLMTTPAEPESSDSVSIQWETTNEGNIPTSGSFWERIVVVNTTTSETLLSTNLYYNEVDAGNGPIAAADSRSRQYEFTLPDGPSAQGI